MTSFREFAPAKINLTLEVAGRRDDGFHEIRSLVAFARAGDVVTLEPGAARALTVSGPFADKLSGPNILSRALELLASTEAGLPTGSVHLEKNLPVAAGIGGGSADAGALLRVLRRASGEAGNAVDWHRFALTLGADVPVCLESRALWMTGVGEQLADIPDGFPVLHTVLVNPLADVPADKTARVFRALAAPRLAAHYGAPPAPRFADRDGLLAFMRVCGNGLAPAAEAVVPEIGAVLAALTSLPQIEYAALSGAGPTCFGVFPSAEAAAAAEAALAAAWPTWWVAASDIG